jgi:ribosome-associated protein
VICSGESSRQIEAIRDEVSQAMKSEGILPHHYEGNADSGWLLIDFSDIIVHLFSPDQREHYQLDKLWEEATPVIRIQ